MTRELTRRYQKVSKGIETARKAGGSFVGRVGLVGLVGRVYLRWTGFPTSGMEVSNIRDGQVATCPYRVN